MVALRELPLPESPDAADAEDATIAIESEALDAYSVAVSGAAARLIPSVASLRVERRGGGWGSGAGSAVAFTPDGFLVTNAHVVAGAERGHAAFVAGDELRFEVVGRDPLSDLAVVRAAGRSPRRRSVMRLACGSGSSSSRSATRSGSGAR